MRNLFGILFLLIYQVSFSQITLKGRLLDEAQKPIPNVSVSYKTPHTEAILGFTKTNTHGQFEIQVRKLDTDSIQLYFNHLSYQKRSVVVVNRSANYAYTLKTEIRQIEEIKTINTPIYRWKDTINYDVESFTDQNDRIIADIIKKIPGIEIRDDAIYYQGRLIQKYMVNNLDLMEGRYALINNSMPAASVKKIQIIENDQPIKILDSLVPSDKASLNLVLKKFTTTGSGTIALGLSPALWDLNLTPMTFGKTFQMVNSFQSNNSGNDVSSNLQSLYRGFAFKSNDDPEVHGPSFLSIRNIPSPSFHSKKWLDNKIFAWSNDMLQKLKNDVQIKVNLSYFDDTKKRRGFTRTQYFTTAQQIQSTEAIDNSYRINQLQASLSIEKNAKKIFLRNTTTFQKRWNSDRGNLLFNNDMPILQNSILTDEVFLNSLSIMRLIGEKMIFLNSAIEYHQTPQRLTVSPGQFTDILNAGDPYEQMNQLVLYKGLSWNNSVISQHKVKKWGFSLVATANYQQNRLNSFVTITDLGNTNKLEGDFVNAMDNSLLSLFGSSRISWEDKKWKFNIFSPYKLYYYNAKQQTVKTLNNVLKNTFNPSIKLNYVVNNNNQLEATASIGKNYGGLNNFYNGYIINQYRSMQKYNTRLLGTDDISAQANYDYRNTVKGNAANIAYSFTKSRLDYILNTHLDSLAHSTTRILDHISNSAEHRLQSVVSHFFSSSKTLIRIHGTVSWNQSDHLLNDEMLLQKTNNQSAALSINKTISKGFLSEYRTNVGRMTRKIAGGKQNIFYNNHYLNLTLHPFKNHMLTINNSLYSNNISSQKNQLFIDLNYRYTLSKWKTDIQLQGQNITNTGRFTQQFYNTIELVQSSFEMRPRQFMIATRFRF